MEELEVLEVVAADRRRRERPHSLPSPAAPSRPEYDETSGQTSPGQAGPGRAKVQEFRPL